MTLKYLLTLSAAFFVMSAGAQTFIIDNHGHISDPKFRQLIKSRGYELVGNFDTIQMVPMIVAAPFQKNGKWGKIDIHGKVIEEAKEMNFEPATRPVKGDAGSDYDQPSTYTRPANTGKPVFTKYSNNGKYGSHDASGKEGIPAIYDAVFFYNDSTAYVKSGALYGAFTTSGKLLVPVSYDYIIYTPNPAQAFVVKKGKYYGMFFKGRETIPTQYDRIVFDYRFKTLVKVTTNGKTALFNIVGKQLTDITYDQLQDFNPAGAAIYRIGISSTTAMGLIDTLGKQITAQHREVSTFGTRLYKVSDGIYPNQKMGIIDTHGKAITPQDYDRIDYLSQGLAKAIRANKTGFIDSLGKEVIKTNYTSIEYFNGKTGLAIVKQDKKYGLISRTEEPVVPPTYDLLESYSAGRVYHTVLDKKHGLIDRKGKVLVPPAYDHLNSINQYGYRVILNQKEGLLDDDGKVIAPLKYESIETPNNYKVLDHGIFSAVLDGKKIRVDLYGNEYTEKLPVEKVADFKPDKDGHVSDPDFLQLIKQRGFQLVSAFDTLQKKPLVLAAKVLIDGKWKVMDTKGKYYGPADMSFYTGGYGSARGSEALYSGSDVKVTEMRSDVTIDEPIDNNKSGFEQVVVNSKYGTLNKATNKVGLPAIYNGITFMGNGWVMVKLGDKYGMAMDDGQVMLQPQYETITPFVIVHGKFSFESLFVRQNGKYGLVTGNGTVIIPIKYDQLQSAYGADKSNQLLKFAETKKWGLVTRKGKILVPPTYDEINTLVPGLLRTTAGDSYPKKYGLIDTTGKVLLEPIYATVEKDYSNKDRIHFVLNNNGTKQGYLSLSGKVIFKPAYDEIYEFGNGLARVKVNGKYGIMRQDEKFMIEPIYDGLYIFHEKQFIMAELAGKNGIFDMKGGKLIPIEYEELYPGSNGNFIFKRSSKWGIMTAKEKVLMTLEYQDIHPGYNCFIVSNGARYGLMSNDGKLLTPIKYDRFQNGSNTLKNGLAEATLNRNRIIIDTYGNEYASQ